MLLEEGKGDGDPSMPKPEPLEVAVLPHLFFPVSRKQSFCRLPFVFEAASGFLEPFPWEHASILYLKARIQLKLRIREQSRELTTPHDCEEDAIEQAVSAAAAPYCGHRCRRAAPGASADPQKQSLPSRQASGSSQRDRDHLQTKYFVFLSGRAQCLTMFSLVLTSILPTKVSSHICFPW